MYPIQWLCVPHLVFIVEQFGELRHGACGQLGVVLVVDQMDDGRLEHLGGLGQPLDVGHLGRVCLSRQDGGASLQSLWEYCSPHPLGSRSELKLCWEVRWWWWWYHMPDVIKAKAGVYAYCLLSYQALWPWWWSWCSAWRWCTRRRLLWQWWLQTGCPSLCHISTAATLPPSPCRCLAHPLPRKKTGSVRCKNRLDQSQHSGFNKNGNEDI